MATDPVCGMTVDETSALRTERDGRTYYFCCEHCRQKFLERELAREQATLRGIRAEVGHRYHEAVWMVSLIIQQFRTELRWLRRLTQEIKRRAPARRR